MTKKSSENFSLALGLFDYINPIFYCITSITLIKNLRGVMDKPLFILMVLGQIISMIFGLAIPTVKCIVGLGKMKFKMPVDLVFYVNCGIFVTGLCIFTFVFKVSEWIMFSTILLVLLSLLFIYKRSKKFNTVAVLIGMVGYLMIYSSLISYAIKFGYIVSIVMYGIAICLFLFLVGIGCFANLKDARVHWVIEISNVICQGLVAISTILLFH